MVVMSQGVLFRGQPEQTEEEDGQNQKADAEYVIRRGLIEADLIEAVVVLPGKLFYGNNVPGCLVLLNKAKPAERKDKILMIWASRDFQKGNPQNLLRPSDLMRILVPCRAFGDLEVARRLVADHEARLVREVEEQRDARLADIEDAYGSVLAPLSHLEAELATLEALDLRVQAVKDAILPEHPYFHPLAALHAEVERIESEIAAAGRTEKASLKARLQTAKAQFDAARKKLIDAVKARHKQVARAVKELGKLKEERDTREREVRLAAEREISHLRDAAAELLRICQSANAARRYFTVVDRAEIEENEFNLNLPRYVDTFEPEEDFLSLKQLKDSGMLNLRARTPQGRWRPFLRFCSYDDRALASLGRHAGVPRASRRLELAIPYRYRRCHSWSVAAIRNLQPKERRDSLSAGVRRVRARTPFYGSVVL